MLAPPPRLPQDETSTAPRRLLQEHPCYAHPQGQEQLEGDQEVTVAQEELGAKEHQETTREVARSQTSTTQLSGEWRRRPCGPMLGCSCQACGR